MTARIEKVLLLCCGNPSRGDDGLGPAAAEYIEKLNLPNVSVDCDYQLTVEDSAAIAQSDAVIFVDASVNCDEPFVFQRLYAGGTISFSSHSVEPGEVLALAEKLFESKAKGFILGIRGYEFDIFDSPLSVKAKANFDKAMFFLTELLKRKNFEQALNS